jgi:endonuclease/exonuclease/phosphatase family metal-dependent hydrolase
LISCSNRIAGGKRNAAIAQITVLAYNIHHANPPSKPGLIDIEAIARVIRTENPDVVALQEIDVNTERSGKELHEANKLAELTGMKAYFAKTIDYGGGAYGIAILSKHPMREMQNHPLPTKASTGGEPRALATAIITLPGGREFLFASTHLDAQRNDTNRIMQIKRITEKLANEKLPAIIAGDFNAVPESEVISILDSHFARTCINGCGYTIPEVNPTKTIDYIAFKPAGSFRVVEHKVINEPYASDHLPVKAVLELR